MWVNKKTDGNTTENGISEAGVLYNCFSGDEQDVIASTSTTYDDGTHGTNNKGIEWLDYRGTMYYATKNKSGSGISSVPVDTKTNNLSNDKLFLLSI